MLHRPDVCSMVQEGHIKVHARHSECSIKTCTEKWGLSHRPGVCSVVQEGHIKVHARHSDCSIKTCTEEWASRIELRCGMWCRRGTFLLAFFLRKVKSSRKRCAEGATQ